MSLENCHSRYAGAVGTRHATFFDHFFHTMVEYEGKELSAVPGVMAARFPNNTACICSKRREGEADGTDPLQHIFSEISEEKLCVGLCKEIV